MSILTLAQEAQLAQEVVAQVLQGALHHHGSQKAFAARAGISPVFVNYIIHQNRMPKCGMAERMAQHLPLSCGESKAWLGYVESYWRAQHALTQAMPAVITDDFPHLAETVQQLRLRAVRTSSPDAARLDYRVALMLSSQMLRITALAQHPLLYLQTIEVFQEVNSFLGQRVDALWSAKRLQWVACELEPEVRRDELTHFHKLRLNALRNEAVILNDLHLHVRAYGLLQQLQADPCFKAYFQAWLPIVAWDQMNAMAHLPRSSLHEARDAWRMGQACGERYAQDWTELCHALLARSYAEVAISHGRFEEAHQVLDGFYKRMDSIPFFGAFYQVLLGQTYARLLWEEPRPDKALWNIVATRTYQTASRAGFVQQAHEMEQTYGTALQMTSA